MSQQIELLIPAISEPEDANWQRVEAEALANYRTLLGTYPGAPIGGAAVSVRNLGKGADWSVIAVTIGGLFFVVPEAHKRVRESLEEYKRIWKELKQLSSWLSKGSTVLHPDHYLFLAALFQAAEQVSAEALVFLGTLSLPEEHPDLREHPPLLFSFLSGTTVLQFALARDSTVIWSNRLELQSLGPNNSSKPTPLRGAA